MCNIGPWNNSHRVKQSKDNEFDEQAISVEYFNIDLCITVYFWDFKILVFISLSLISSTKRSNEWNSLTHSAYYEVLWLLLRIANKLRLFWALLYQKSVMVLYFSAPFWRLVSTCLLRIFNKNSWAALLFIFAPAICARAGIIISLSSVSFNFSWF